MTGKFLPLILALMASGEPGASFADEVSAAMAPGEFAAYVEDGRTRFDQAKSALPRFDALMEHVRQQPGGLRGLPLEALRSLAMDAHVANFYFAGARPDAHRDIVEELLDRSAASEQDLVDFHGALVAARRWDEARDFARRFPEAPMETLPGVRMGDGLQHGPYYLRPLPAENVVVRESLGAGKGLSLVVVSHPDCGYSRAAMAAIEANPALGDALPANRLYLAPTFGKLRFARVAQWNARHPAFSHVLVDRPADWTFVSNWATPQFLFLRDGKVVEAVTGWPGEAQIELLTAAARRAARPPAD